jgi:O-Antigen ligase
MTNRTGAHIAWSQVVSVAAAQTRLVLRAIPGVIHYLAPIVAWAAVSITVGVGVGFAAVVLPPLAAFGIVAGVGVVLLWVMPEVPLVYPALIRKTYFIMLVVNLCVPAYYTVQFGGLPWISARRLATFSLVAPFLLAIASSHKVRDEIMQRIRPSWLLVVCALGYLVMASLSIVTSTLPETSLTALVDCILTWYLPLFAAIYVIKDEDDIIFAMIVICFCALFNTALGILEFHAQRRFLIDVFPPSMLNELIANNPVFEALLNTQKYFRNGYFRASSTFMTPLAFGEFEMMIIPIGLFFALERQKLIEKGLGWMVVFGGIVGIFASGSRGAYLGFFLSTAVFLVAWPVRLARMSRVSLAPAFFGIAGAVSLAALVLLVEVSPAFHNRVLGGGAQASSNEGRRLQWEAGLPLIEANPITGHGLATGGYDINSSIDTYVLSLLVETGVPGLIFFAGIVCVPIWFGLRNYIYDLSESGALSGALACSFVAFATYRFALSQRENHLLLFSLVAMAMVLSYERRLKQEPGKQMHRQPRRSYSSADGKLTRGNVTAA